MRQNEACAAGSVPFGVMTSPGRKPLEERRGQWSFRMTSVIAEQITAAREARTPRKLTTAQLAERCEALGVPFKRSTLAGLESGRRDSVSMAEWFALAAALEVPPLALVLPTADDRVEILPGRWVPLAEAYAWLSDPDAPAPVAWTFGDDGKSSKPVDVQGDLTLVDDDTPAVRRLRGRLRRLLSHQKAARLARRSGPARQAGRRRLAEIRHVISDAGEPLPLLPPDLASVDVEHPEDRPIEDETARGRQARYLATQMEDVPDVGGDD